MPSPECAAVPRNALQRERSAHRRARRPHSKDAHRRRRTRPSLRHLGLASHPTRQTEYRCPLHGHILDRPQPTRIQPAPDHHHVVPDWIPPLGNRTRTWCIPGPSRAMIARRGSVTARKRLGSFMGAASRLWTRAQTRSAGHSCGWIGDSGDLCGRRRPRPGMKPLPDLLETVISQRLFTQPHPTPGSTPVPGCPCPRPPAPARAS